MKKLTVKDLVDNISKIEELLAIPDMSWGESDIATAKEQLSIYLNNILYIPVEDLSVSHLV